MLVKGLIWGGVIVLAALVVLFIIGNKSVHHEIIVDAPPAKVWQVISDTESYAEWNPVMLSVDATPTLGAKVTYKYQQEPGKVYDIPVTVKAMDAEKLLNQAGGMPGILTYNHRYELVAMNNGESTKVIIHEDYRGIGVPFWNPDAVGASYGRLNEAIKARAEAQ